MTLQPLLAAPVPVQIHAASAVLAVLIGAFVLWRRKGTRLHKTMGRVWVVLMLATATSAFFIQEIRLVGPFSPIHLFSLITYVSLSRGLYAIMVRRDTVRHRVEMQSLYLQALVLAGAFTFLPGRRMQMVMFGPDAGWTESGLAIGTILGLAALVSWRLRWRQDRKVQA